MIIMNIGRNEVNEFFYASSLNTVGQAIVPAYSSAAADKKKRIRVTDLQISCAGTACDIELGGNEGRYNPMGFKVAANSNANFNWQIPYSLDTVSSTGEARMIYASSSDVGVKVVVTGYYELNE